MPDDADPMGDAPPPIKNTAQVYLDRSLQQDGGGYAIAYALMLFAAAQHRTADALAEMQRHKPEVTARQEDPFAQYLGREIDTLPQSQSPVGLYAAIREASAADPITRYLHDRDQGL